MVTSATAPTSEVWRYAPKPLVLGIACAALLLAIAGARGENAPGFDGPWETSYGYMELQSEGKHVTGYYLFDGERSAIDGVMTDGETLEFSYHEPAVSGSGVFVLNDDRQSFSGKWRETSSQAWETWIGKRPKKESTAYTGIWDTNFGRVRLVQDGDAVTGTYESGGEATIQGTVTGRKLTFTYKEEAAQGEGWFELSPDARSFDGKWRSTSAKSSTWQNWNGSRVVAEPGVTWLVVLEANWEESMAESEYNFGDIIKTFFARAPSVRVRHRRFATEEELRHWLSEVSYLVEPTVVVISSHGTEKGVFGSAMQTPVSPSVFSDTLRNAPNVKLLHLASCLTMKGDYATRILKGMPASARFPVSGYATSVDWGGSALADLLYYELVLVHGFKPAKAFKETLSLLPLAGAEGKKSDVIPALDMRMVEPDAL